MSRVGKMPVSLPQGLDVSVTAERITVKGPLGTLVRPANPLVNVSNNAGGLARPHHPHQHDCLDQPHTAPTSQPRGQGHA